MVPQFGYPQTVSTLQGKGGLGVGVQVGGVVGVGRGLGGRGVKVGVKVGVCVGVGVSVKVGVGVLVGVGVAVDVGVDVGVQVGGKVGVPFTSVVGVSAITPATKPEPWANEPTGDGGKGLKNTLGLTKMMP